MVDREHTSRHARDPARHHFALRARWVLPVDRPPLDGAVVTIRGRYIESVGTNSSPHPPHDLGDVVLLPGLVNPHVHLEFSQRRQPIGRPGMRFPDWITEVVQWRREEFGAHEDEARRRWQLAVGRGLRECLAAGVTTVAEIATRPWQPAGPAAAGVDVLVLRELLGYPAQRAADQIHIARQHLAQQPNRRLRHGLAPHAPYTVRWDLLQTACRLAAAQDCLVAMHVAESREELELLASGSGPLRERLEQFEAWDPTPSARRGSIVDYLMLLSEAPRSLVVHGNYLNERAWQLLARRRGRMAVVYCPRTHAFFRHADYPLAEMLAAGVRVVVGTDGRASNPDLDLLTELRTAARLHPRVDPAIILRAGTSEAAAALGCADDRGSLSPGKRADLAVVRLPRQPGGDLWQNLFGSNEPVVQTYLAGHQVLPP